MLTYNNNLNLILLKNTPYTDPLVDLYIGFSPPCGNTKGKFNLRSNVTHPYELNHVECDFQKDDR